MIAEKHKPTLRGLVQKLVDKMEAPPGVDFQLFKARPARLSFSSPFAATKKRGPAQRGPPLGLFSPPPLPPS